ncbi:MAG: PIN domain-containing protein [Nitrospinae bacterium]|nr:PIN domain-containing protein [Nitrospinota bacterium]
MPDKCFFDTNLWIYLFLDSKDPDDRKKKRKVEKLINEDDIEIVVSTQVLNEICSVLLKKYKIKADSIKEHLERMLDIVEVNILTEQNTLKSLSLLEKYNLSFYDAIIISSAIESDCNIILSEDLQSELIIEGNLKIINPFK